MTYLIVLVAVAARFVPHPWNFSPVYGALLFAGARLRTRDAFWYPLALLAASDFLLTSVIDGLRFSWLWEAPDLVAFAALVLLGRAIRKRVTARNVVAASLAGATAFFLITNLGVWLFFKTFPVTLNGLIACFAAALPFFRNTVESTFLWSALLFGGYELAKFFAAHRRQTVA